MVVKIISEYKHIKKYTRDGHKIPPVVKGHKRVMASVNGQTRHMDVPIHFK